MEDIVYPWVVLIMFSWTGNRCMAEQMDGNWRAITMTWVIKCYHHCFLIIHSMKFNYDVEMIYILSSRPCGVSSSSRVWELVCTVRLQYQYLEITKCVICVPPWNPIKSCIVPQRHVWRSNLTRAHFIASCIYWIWYNIQHTQG